MQDNNSKTGLFQPSDKSYFGLMLRSEILQWKLNRTPLWNIPLRNWIIKKLFGSIDGAAYCIQNPIHVSYGKNIFIGKNFFANYNCVIMDHAMVQIGDNCLLAPNVSLLTIKHPLVAEERIVRFVENSFEPHHRGNYELIQPITIGNNVWIAAGCTVCAGVTIGDNSVIGAGSVVTRDIPANVLAFGTPCRVIRPISEDDRVLF